MRARLTRHPGPESRFIDPDVLARIDDLELVARTVVEGFISGLHRSPFLGLSMDFAEHRPYMPGDDIRRIDWRLYARTDRFYVKEFEAETNVNAFFALDVSRSMDFGSGGITKLDYGRFLAASLAYLSSRQRDRVGFASFDADVIEHVPPSARRRETVLHAIDRARSGGTGELAGPLVRIGESLRRRGIVAVISDLYAEPDAVLGAVAGLRSRGHDLVVFHVLDPAELRFPFEEASSFEDLETGEQLPVTPEAMVERYLTLVDEHTRTLARRMLENGIDYALFDTSVPLDHALFHYLSHRERRRRSR
jgi:uncharacterized protein (DUF58 family)